MKATFEFSKSDIDGFDNKCQAAIRNVSRGTKKATTAACEEILKVSLEQVPRDTSTLASSAFYEVSRRTDTAKTTWAYEAIIGYGGNGDPVNPKTGQPASVYMTEVHEDLSAYHPVGKAKFLEDPIRDYANEKFNRNFFTFIKEALASIID